MSQVYKVAIHFENTCGQIEYDLEQKKIQVILDHEAKRKEIEEYLNKQHTINRGVELREFVAETGMPADNVEFLKLCLTRMWNQIGVFVDWSRPVQ